MSLKTVLITTCVLVTLQFQIQPSEAAAQQNALVANEQLGTQLAAGQGPAQGGNSPAATDNAWSSTSANQHNSAGSSSTGANNNGNVPTQTNTTAGSNNGNANSNASTGTEDAYIQKFQSVKGLEATQPAGTQANGQEAAPPEENQEEGFLGGVIVSFVVLYKLISNNFFYPLLIVIVFIMTIILVIWSVKIYLNLRKNDNYVAKKPLLYLLLYFICYIDVFAFLFVKKEEMKILFSMEKDFVMLTLGAFIGFLIGKLASRESFEEKALP